MAMNSRKTAEILIKWFKAEGADLPWRHTTDPYEIWVSEVLLQQTQVSRVLDYYKKFLEKFPRLEDLARANWNSVLPAWRGLGYYSRGKNMLQAAKVIKKEHAGKFPDRLEALQELPGVGAYTASAILCFAFGERLPALDTNLKRVLRRLEDSSPDQVPEIARNLFRGHRYSARNLNYALMDIGRNFCKGRSVRCPACPLKKICKSYRSGKIELEMKALVSSKDAKKASKGLAVGVGCIHHRGKYLLARRPRSKGGEWEFPGGKCESGESIRSCLKRELLEELDIEVSVRPHFLVHDVQANGQRYSLYFSRCQILRGRPRAREHQQIGWFTPDEMQYIELADSNTIVLAHLRAFRK